ncbi:MAG: hypothetical protein CMH56_06990 [Myxococcales bacterium]|nr:hypothetical protein [Myxococcales bacterium]
MSKRILLVDDDSQLLETVETFLVSENFIVITAKNHDEALEKIQASKQNGEEIHLYVLDVLMPGKNGLELGKEIRRRADNTPILFVTGVFKNQSNQAVALKQLRAHAFILKPFGGEEILTKIKEVFGMQDSPSDHYGGQGESSSAKQAPLPEKGFLLQAPVPYFLWRVSREKLSGILDLKDGESAHARLFFFRGRLALAQSSNPDLNLGAFLVKNKKITDNDFETAAQKAVKTRQGLYRVFQEARILDDDGLKIIFKTLAPDIVSDVFAMSGRFRWVSTEGFTKHIPTASLPIEPILKTALAQSERGPLDEHLKPRASLRLSYGPDWTLVSPVLNEFCGADDIIRSVNGRATIAQMIAAARDDHAQLLRMRQVFFLLCANAVDVTAEAVDKPNVEPHPEATPEAPSAGVRIKEDIPSDTGVQFTDEEHASRQKIAAQFKLQKDKNHWEVLGLTTSATDDEIRKAYFALAKDFHSDAFTGQNLGAMAELLQMVFSRISEAYKVLLNAEARTEYERKLDMEAKGMATDVDKVFAAEDKFLRGQRLMERGEFKAALEYFVGACELNPGSETAQAYRQYVDWSIHQDTSQAHQAIQNIEAHYKACPHEHVFLEFMGSIALSAGMTDDAITYFKKCLKHLPKNINAQRSLRLIAQRQGKPPAPGLMDKLTKGS